MTVEELKEEASRLGYSIVENRNSIQSVHKERGRRWVYTSEIDKVHIKGALDSYITLVDDALDEVTPPLKRKYT